MVREHERLTWRERQIMDVLYARGRASVAEVLEDIPDPPSYSAVRALLRILEEKGHARHEQDGPRYVFLPRVTRSRARQSAIRHLVETFYNGSAEQAVAALIDANSARLSKEELDRLASLIEQRRKEKRG